MKKVSSTYRFHNLEGFSAVLRVLDSNSFMYMMTTIRLIGDLMASLPYLFIELSLKQKYVLYTENSTTCMMYCTDNTVLC